VSDPSANRSANGFRTKLFAALGAIALLVIGAIVTPLGGKLVDLIWPAAEPELSDALVAGEGCQSGGPAVSVALDYGFRGSTWWATSQPLPPSTLDELRKEPDPAVVLAKYSPVQSQYRAGTLLKLVVTGCGPKPVVITEMRASIVKRNKPLDGGVVFRPPEGDLNVESIGFDLDAKETTALTYDARPGKLGGSFFAGKAVQVAPGESVPFSVMGLTKKSYLEWTLAFETLVDGKAWKFTVALAGGKPIQSNAVAASYRSAFQDSVLTGYSAVDGTKIAGTLRLP
jgi:hypothetical protein